MNDVITKPYKKEQLAQCLDHWLPNSLKQKNMTKTHSPSEALTTTYQTLNKITFEELKNNMGEDLESIIKAGLESLLSNIKKIAESSNETSIDDLTMWAHSIKSPAVFLGAERISEYARTIEQALKDKEEIDMKKVGIEIINEFELVKKIIGKLTPI